MKNLILFSLVTMGLAACVSLPKSVQTKDEVIAVGPGPEDMVVDTISEMPRILISCNERRDGQPYYGEIYVYYPNGSKSKLLKRINEPADFRFNPHGIDLVKVKDSLILLVVNHEREKHINSIVRYKVDKDNMYFLNKIVDPLISSPNAVSGLPDGTLLISNDAKKHGNIWEPLLKLKRAQIIHWNGSTCSVASQKYCYSNGITNRNNKVYLASTRQAKVWEFDYKDGQMLNRRVVARIQGPDNIRFEGENLLVPCHLRFMAFLKHMKDSTRYSPTTVYRINPAAKTKEVVFYDSGAQLSAGSTTVEYNGYLYSSGVFDAKIDKKRLK